MSILRTYLVILFLISTSILFAKEKDNKYWNLGMAPTIEKGRFEVGLFQPLRYGITDTLEISTFPLFAFVLPNVTIKKNYINREKLSFSTEHSLLYPTLGLSLVSKNGIAGLLPHTSKIPQILVFDNSALATYKLSKYFIVTGKINLSIPIIFTDVKDEEFPVVDMMLLYPRTASYQGMIVYNLSLDIDGLIAGDFYYTVDLDLYNSLISYSDKSMNLNIETKLLITWKYSDCFALFLGVKHIIGDYPGTKSKTLSVVPLFDLSWAF